MDTFAQRLRTFRLKKKLSLQELADAIGASKGHVWDMEQGKTKNPSLSMLTELSRVLGAPIIELIGESQTTENSELAPLFRDLRGLSSEDLNIIRILTDQLRNRGNGNTSNN